MADSLVLYLPECLAMAGISFTICWLLVVVAKVVPRLSGRPSDVSAVQAMHTHMTPRVAGIAVFSALVVSIAFAPVAYSDQYAVFVGATAVLFFIGLLEDLGIHIPAKTRLLYAFVSSLLVVAGLNIWLSRVGLPWVDPYMEYWPIGVVVTIFVTAGIANGFNLIDGVNGLAALAAIVCAVSLSIIANQVGYTLAVKFNLMLAFAVLGFGLVNFPHGRIFLGDAGAYTLGFVLSWLGVFALVRFPEISPWAVLLTMFWPVADTCLAIYRRARRRSIAFLPDRLHVHQLVMRALEILVLGRGRRHLANPLTTVVLSPFIIMPALTGVWLWNDDGAAGLAVLVYAVAFFGSYVLAFPLLRRLPRRCGRSGEIQRLAGE